MYFSLQLNVSNNIMGTVLIIIHKCECFCCLSQAIVMVLESKGEKTFKMVLQLLKFLSASSIITVDQMRRVRCHLAFEGCIAQNCFTRMNKLICLLLFLVVSNCVFVSFTGL